MYALRALNIEIANSTGKVTSEHTALGRLLFWENEIKRKALSNSIAPTMQRTPVSTELDFLKENYKIPTRWILRLVEARKNRLEFGRQYQTFKNIDELNQYSEQTHGTILLCCLHAMGSRDAAIDKASANIARVQGLSQNLRGTAFWASRRHVVLPLDLIAQHNVDVRDLIYTRENQGGMTTNKQIEDLIFDLSSRAVGYITMTRSQFKFKDEKTDKQVKEFKKLFCISIAPSEAFLNSLEKHHFDIFSKELQKRNDKLVWDTYNKLLFDKRGY